MTRRWVMFSLSVIAPLLVWMVWSEEPTASLPKIASFPGAADRIKSWTINGQPAKDGVVFEIGETFVSTVSLNNTQKKNPSSPSELPINAIWLRFSSDLPDLSIREGSGPGQGFQFFGMSRDRKTKTLSLRPCKMTPPEIEGTYELQLVVNETRMNPNTFTGGRVAGVIVVRVTRKRSPSGP